jgi:hypothetical protein
MDEFKIGQEKMFGLAVLYFLSINFFKSLPSPLVYHFNQEAGRQIFKSLKLGIPNPP